MQRRELLSARGVAPVLGEVISAWADVPGELVAEVECLRFSRRGMATLFEMLLPDTTLDGEAIGIDILEQIDDLEAQLSIYIDDSEVSQLNRNGFTKPVVLEEGLFALLRTAAEISHRTHGAFDVTSGSLSRIWGFPQRKGRVPTPQERAEAKAKTGTRFLVFDDRDRSVRFLRDGLEINLGGIGKGYALDCLEKGLRSRGVSSALLHGGSSSVLAVGVPPGLPRGWPIAVRHPWKSSGDATGILGRLHLKEAAMGTSASTFQHFDYNGTKLGHVIDPRSAWPATGMQQVTAIAATAADADAVSTALFVLGYEAACEWCRTHPEVGAILLPDGTDTPTVWNLRPGTFEPSPTQ